MSKQIKLMALDNEDLEVVSALCQDAILKVGEADYIPAEKRFVLWLNRFVWENEDEASPQTSAKGKTHERRKSLLQFARVNKVQVSGINPKDKEMVISILAITFKPDEEPSGSIELVLAGDGAIKLEVECIEVQLLDTPAAWQTKSVPLHTSTTP